MSNFAEDAPLESRYLTQEFYDELIAWRDASKDLSRAEDINLQHECAQLLYHEARLLDNRRFEDWLSLYSEECLYWAPAEPLADPREQVNIMFDDRRRLVDRIVRLETGFAHNQEPNRRMRRLVTNIEAWEDDAGLNRRVLANEKVYEHRTNRQMVDYIVGLDYWLVREGDQWKIKVKKAQLINSLDGIELPTFL